MSLEGRLRELAAVAEAAPALIQEHRLETEEAVRELSERVARLEAAQVRESETSSVRNPRTRKESGQT